MLSIIAASLSAHAVAACLGVAFGRRARVAVYALSAAASAVAAIAAAWFLAGGAPDETAWLPIGLPWVGAHFRLDPLAAYFLIVANTVAAVVGFYALDYTRHETEPERALPFFPLFLAAMNLVVLADDAFGFLVSWELMSLASWLLVLANHRESETAPAAYLYIVMAAFGTGALLFAFGLLSAGAGSYAFGAIRGAALPASRGLLIFLLACIGTGSKAGIVPLHVWLPPAHAAAPSHVSAMMSGVMTKIALYGLIRILFDLAGPAPWWWGLLLLVIGGVTALLGVLYAVMQHDLKRLLAYHTVENIGIIVIGLGLSLAFRADGLPILAGLAFGAALLHVANHATFKSLLFLGAGAVITATHTRDMEQLGGLIHRLPRTAFFFLIGAIAISALPPLNGFVSEWLTFQAIIFGASLPQWTLKIAVPLVGAMLALAAALAGICFVKVYGIVFLGRPRSDAARDATEVSPVLWAPMAALAAICVALGVLPMLALRPIDAVMARLFGDGVPAMAPLHPADWVWLTPLGPEHSSYSGLIVLAAITVLASGLAWIIHRIASNRLRRGPAWDCGFPSPSAATQYTASSFAQPIRHVFGRIVFAARDTVDMPAPGETRPARFTSTLIDPIWNGLYKPVARATGFLADHLNATQFLTIRQYLSLMFGALILLLLVEAVSQ